MKSFSTIGVLTRLSFHNEGHLRTFQGISHANMSKYEIQTTVKKYEIICF